MSVKIRVSYEYEKELNYILEKMNGSINKCTKQEAKGKYQRAYISLNDNLK